MGYFDSQGLWNLSLKKKIREFLKALKRQDHQVALYLTQIGSQLSLWHGIFLWNFMVFSVGGGHPQGWTVQKRVIFQNTFVKHLRENFFRFWCCIAALVFRAQYCCVGLSGYLQWFPDVIPQFGHVACCFVLIVAHFLATFAFVFAPAFRCRMIPKIVHPRGHFKNHPLNQTFLSCLFCFLSQLKITIRKESRSPPWMCLFENAPEFFCTVVYWIWKFRRFDFVMFFDRSFIPQLSERFQFFTICVPRMNVVGEGRHTCVYCGGFSNSF